MATVQLASDDGSRFEMEVSESLLVRIRRLLLDADQDVTLRTPSAPPVPSLPHFALPCDPRFRLTQRFGANPQNYRAFGLPGHEGLDWATPPGTPITAVAPGRVYRVHRKPSGHVYGVHVRIEHDDGYKSIYCHLARADVRTGEQINAGDMIGLSGSSGNSTGPHLHLTIKRKGATVAGETDYPYDIVDPEPFFPQLFLEYDDG